VLQLKLGFIPGFSLLSGFGSAARYGWIRRFSMPIMRHSYRVCRCELASFGVGVYMPS